MAQLANLGVVAMHSLYEHQTAFIVGGLFQRRELVWLEDHFASLATANCRNSSVLAQARSTISPHTLT